MEQAHWDEDRKKMNGILKLLCTEKNISTAEKHKASMPAISWPKMPIKELCLYVYTPWRGDTWHHRSILVTVSDTLSKWGYTAVTSVGLLQHEVHSCFLKRGCSALCKSGFKSSYMGSIRDAPEIWIIQQISVDIGIVHLDTASFSVALLFPALFRS